MKIPYFFFLLITLILNSCSGQTVETNQSDKSRHNKWMEDLEYFDNEYLVDSKTFSEDSIAVCKKRIAELKLKVDSLNDNQIILELSRCVAMADNGHTTIHLGWMKKIPLRFFWFSDGLYIIKTTNTLSQYLGAKVLMINSIETNKVQRKLNPYLSGNDNWKKFTATNYLCSPQVLNGINLSDSSYLNLTLLINSDTITTQFEISKATDEKYEYNAWENLYPPKSDTEDDWMHVLDSLGNIPFYLQHSDKGAFYYFLDSKKIAYFNLNTTWDRGVKLTDIINEFLDSLKMKQDYSVIMDLRFNTGGNFMLPLKLAKKTPKIIDDNSKIYLVTSNMTFSAGLVTAARIKYFAKDKIIIVGEKVGDNLKFWAEGVYYELPNSGLTIQDSKYAHDWADDKFVPFKTYWFNLLFGVPAKDLNVDKEIKISFAEYLKGQDPIIDWIIKQEK